ncbi:MAG: 50S ribosomal protein L10 [Bacteroidota bacterium]|nr:50S ribosomal protein L10 [Bacteroidota bacterium]
MTKEKKAEIIREAADRIRRASGLYLLNFAGMTVAQANAFRRECHARGIEYFVAKNTLLKRAFEEVGGYEGLYPYLVQPTGMVVVYDDAVAPARILEKFIRDNNQKPAVKACMIDRQVFDGARLSEIAALPTKPDLIAGIIAAVESPVRGIIGAIQGVSAGIVYAIDAIERRKSQAA